MEDHDHKLGRSDNRAGVDDEGDAARGGGGGDEAGVRKRGCSQVRAERLPCSAARSLPQPSCRDVRGWEFDARDVNSTNMYTVLHDECDDTDENVHIDYHATVRDRYHANGWVRQARLSSAHAMVRDRYHADGWVRQARRSSAPLSPATMDRFKQAVREQREAGYVVHVERYNELIRSA